jgi:hypothetical protein
MRPQVDDTTATVVEELADELTEIDVEMLTFDQQLRVVLKQMDDIEFASRQAGTRQITNAGRIVEQL